MDADPERVARRGPTATSSRISGIRRPDRRPERRRTHPSASPSSPTSRSETPRERLAPNEADGSRNAQRNGVPEDEPHVPDGRVHDPRLLPPRELRDERRFSRRPSRSRSPPRPSRRSRGRPSSSSSARKKITVQGEKVVTTRRSARVAAQAQRGTAAIAEHGCRRFVRERDRHEYPGRRPEPGSHRPRGQEASPSRSSSA